MTHIMQDRTRSEQEISTCPTDQVMRTASHFVLYKFDESYNLLDSTSMPLRRTQRMASNGAFFVDE